MWVEYGVAKIFTFQLALQITKFKLNLLIRGNEKDSSFYDLAYCDELALKIENQSCNKFDVIEANSLPSQQWSRILKVDNNSQVLPVLVDVVESEDVRVLDELHDGDLPLDLLQHRLRQLVLVDDLDGHLLAEHAVRAQFDEACKQEKGKVESDKFQTFWKRQ